MRRNRRRVCSGTQDVRLRVEGSCSSVVPRFPVGVQGFDGRTGSRSRPDQRACLPRPLTARGALAGITLEIPGRIGRDVDLPPGVEHGPRAAAGRPPSGRAPRLRSASVARRDRRGAQGGYSRHPPSRQNGGGLCRHARRRLRGGRPARSPSSRAGPRRAGPASVTMGAHSDPIPGHSRPNQEESVKKTDRDLAPATSRAEPLRQHYAPPRIVWRERYEPVSYGISCAKQPGNPGCNVGPVKG